MDETPKLWDAKFKNPAELGPPGHAQAASLLTSALTPQDSVQFLKLDCSIKWTENACMTEHYSSVRNYGSLYNTFFLDNFL